MKATDKLRDAAQQAMDVLEQLQGGCTDSDDGTVEVITVWCPEVVEALRAALAQKDAQAVRSKFLANGTRFKMSFFQNEDGEGNTVPGTHVTCFEAFEDELDGRWVALVPAEDDCHLNAAPTPPAQRVALTASEILNMMPESIPAEHDGALLEYARAVIEAYERKNGAETTPPAQQPLGWLDRKAVECLQGAELNWMPAWNRPTSADPVPVFLGPPEQRVMLTPEEIQAIWSDLVRHVPPVDQPTQVFARAVIEAYERKNGISQPGYTAPDMASQGASQFRAGHDAAQSEIAELEQENRLLRARNDRLQKEIEQKGER